MKHLLVGHLPPPQSYRAGSVLDHSGGCDRCLAGGDFAAFCGQLWRFYLHKRNIPIGGVLTYFSKVYIPIHKKDDPILTTLSFKDMGLKPLHRLLLEFSPHKKTRRFWDLILQVCNRCRQPKYTTRKAWIHKMMAIFERRQI